MKLGIGDVVRDHRDMALGSVVGITDCTDGRLVAFYVSGDSVRLSGPDCLDLVARSTGAASKLRRLMGRVCFGIALLAAVVSGHDARELGADWPLTLVAALGGYMVVAISYHWGGRIAGPRRFRV